MIEKNSNSINFILLTHYKIIKLSTKMMGLFEMQFKIKCETNNCLLSFRTIVLRVMQEYIIEVFYI